MKINVPLPFDWARDPDDMLTMGALHAVARAIEKAGFYAALVTDHPVPTGRWLDSGGHEAHEPFVTLAMLAAATTKVRLQTGIVVLPYRNPFIVARAVATLDRFSGGRVALSVGAGYLKGEYRALGVDFEQRNELMDEYMRALKVSLTGEEFTFEGTGYTALGNRIVPGPVQKPHVPLYVGGNSRRAIRRAAELGDGWNPFFTAAGQTSTTRTAAMTSEDDLVSGIAYLKDHCAKIGRAETPEIILGSLNSPGENLSSQQTLDRIGHFAELGVAAAGIYVDGDSTAAWCENAERIGSEIISKLGPKA
jgi:probable F420-dependent oxidoreductase